MKPSINLIILNPRVKHVFSSLFSWNPTQKQNSNFNSATTRCKVTSLINIRFTWFQGLQNPVSSLYKLSQPLNLKHYWNLPSNLEVVLVSLEISYSSMIFKLLLLSLPMSNRPQISQVFFVWILSTTLMKTQSSNSIIFEVKIGQIHRAVY